ncbi:ATPase involved in DNA replication [Serpentinimonas maccroryi]|uniref:ATPase involved in DNA replication n=1 Tax=Serpentinimonas maccroryi TaxID=1458426 RepID=A0A060NMY7_9BURK|nr:DNA polymerase [Serpentinimonas maccroryi]BAO83157.1 ATPase involved in DNA replication [Serpentinimonas maccroryi]
MRQALPPWLQRQLASLRQQRSHALLLSGPPGLGQYELALELARVWLCERPSDQGACGACSGCHAIEVRTHPDLFVLLPEVLAIELGWPLDPKTQDKIDKKELKPSQFIRVDPVRAALAFSQVTASRAAAKVVLIHPANRLNVESANALLKTLEEPPAGLRFILSTEAAHALPPTIRSRCLTQQMAWPTEPEALAWLAQVAAPGTLEPQLQAAWRASGGRPEAARQWLASGLDATLWASLPKRVAAGDLSPVREWPLAQQMGLLQQICHDLMSAAVGAEPRFFAAADLPPAPPLAALSAWQRDLVQAARTLEHPFQAALLHEAWALRARQALHSRP